MGKGEVRQGAGEREGKTDGSSKRKIKASLQLSQASVINRSSLMTGMALQVALGVSHLSPL